MARKTNIPDDYPQLLEQLKREIASARTRASLAVNRELVLLYWRIGREILIRQQQAGWGAKIIDQLSADLRKAFPDAKGFSARNLKYMRSFAEAWPDEAIVQQPAAQIPWFHHCILLDKVKNSEQRLWYVQKTIEQGWSRNILAMQIDSNLHQRQGGAVSNFAQTLPAPESDLAHNLLKDPYQFDFLTLADDAREKEIERSLLEHIRQFLLELGVGFAFVGSQYHLEVDGRDFYVDLLFYHCQLHCYFVLELKTGAFQPEYAGKMNFYLSAIDAQLRNPDVDGPTLGLILCRDHDRNRLIVEYALRDMNKPIGVAGFETRLAESLPKTLEGSLPTVEQLEAELESKTSIDDEERMSSI